MNLKSILSSCRLWLSLCLVAVLPALLVGAQSSAQSSGGKVFTLPQAIDLAIKNSQQTRAAQYDLQASKSAVTQSYTNYLPSVKGIGSASATNTTNPYESGRPQLRLGVEVSQLVFDFGKTERSVEVAREAVSEKELAVIESLQRTIAESSRNYINAWYTEQRFKHFREHENTVKEIRDATESRVRIGLAPARELSQIEVRLRRANTDRLKAEYDAISQKEVLAIDTGYSFTEGEVLELDTEAAWFDKIARSQEEARRRSISSNLQLAIARSRSRQAALEASSAFRNYFPSINAVGRYETGRDGDADFVSTTGRLDVNFTFYEGGRTSAAYQQALNRARAINASLTQAERSAESNVRVQWSQLEGLEASRDRWAESLQQQEKLLNQIEAETNEGLQSVIVLLDARADIVDLIVGFERFAADLTLAKINLLELIGALLPDIFDIEVSKTLLEDMPNSYQQIVQEDFSKSYSSGRTSVLLQSPSKDRPVAYGVGGDSGSAPSSIDILKTNNHNDSAD